MRYARIRTESGPQYVAVEDLNGVPHATHIIDAPEEDLTTQPFTGHFTARPLTECKLYAPVTPSKIICIGRNYSEHAAEFGNEPPKEPLLFLKAPSSLIGPGQQIVLPPQSHRVDYEAEIAIVIARKCSQLTETEDVTPYIRGYVSVNDVTARDLQKSDGQWSRAKGFDTFCPVGPWVTDEIHPSDGLTLTTHVNDVEKQRGNTRDLIFDIPTLIRYISQAMTLYPGDLIPTGTPAGVSPIHHGDTVRVTVTGCGVLENPVISRPQRI